MGAQRWVSFLEEGMAELRPQRIHSETVEHSDLEPDSLGSYPCSMSQQFRMTLSWVGNSFCFSFFIHTVEMIIVPAEAQTGPSILTVLYARSCAYPGPLRVCRNGEG